MTATSAPEASGEAAGPSSLKGKVREGAASTAVDAATAAVRLRDLEQRTNAIKDEVFRSKARLSLLGDTVLSGVVGGSQATIVHDARMGASYKLLKITYSLDGAPILKRADDSGALSALRSFDVYSGAMTPGEHTLTVDLEYRGDGYGVFAYLNGYRFRVRSSHVFTAPAGGAIKIRAVAYEKGGPSAPVEERPALLFDDGTEGDAGKPTDAKGQGKTPAPAAAPASAGTSAAASGTTTPVSAGVKAEGAK